MVHCHASEAALVKPPVSCRVGDTCVVDGFGIRVEHLGRPGGAARSCVVDDFGVRVETVIARLRRLRKR